MENKHLKLVDCYYGGDFEGARDMLALDQGNFDAINTSFRTNYDDWYHPHYSHYGARVAPLKALVTNAHSLFRNAHEHMFLGYKNCAISSGTNPHLDAVTHGHHTSDKLARVIGSEKHIWQNIKDNSARSLARAHKIHPLFPELYVVTPTAFEGSTRVLSTSGRKLTGGLQFDGADYMSFWNMAIDMCRGFVLDDVAIDRPPLEQIGREIELAQSYSMETRKRVPIITSDWVNSRNSILEMARGVYIRFGLHPLRPDMQMDMRIYDEQSHSLHKATLLDCTKPVLQNILRWAPQGIATEEACRTAARLLNLHKMRTNPSYNAQQPLPIVTERLEPILRNPSQSEIHEFNRLIERFEPFLLRYTPHLIRTNGLDQSYRDAKKSSALKLVHIGNDITNGDEVVKWQRKNIPLNDVLDLWDLTKPKDFKAEDACPKRDPINGKYRPQRRLHSSDERHAPFSRAQENEIWTDEPFHELDEMLQDMVRMNVAILETGILPLDSPEYPVVAFDMKRGAPALEQAKKKQVVDLSLLPGSLNKEFSKKVSEPNLRTAEKLMDNLRHVTNGQGGQIPQAVFGTPFVKSSHQTFCAVRPDLVGPGPKTPSSNFRLAMEMEVIRRSATQIYFQDHWETSEDQVRKMILAMKIEFGKVDRPAGNNREIKVLNENGQGISLYERYESIRGYLTRLSSDLEIRKHIELRNVEALGELGVRHITNGLAKIIEAYDCLKDPQFNDGRFEMQQVLHQDEFTKDIDKIQETKQETIDNLLKNWVWLWNDKQFEGLRRDYRDAWEDAHGSTAQWEGPSQTDDKAIKREFAP